MFVHIYGWLKVAIGIFCRDKDAATVSLTCLSQCTVLCSGIPLEDKNYQPVSNLSYLGKLIERAACDQLVEFATRTGNIEQNLYIEWDTVQNQPCLK